MFRNAWLIHVHTTCFALFSHVVFFFNDTATTEIYTLSLHDALPISIEIWSFELFPTLHWMSVCHWEVSCKRSIKRQLQPSFSSVGTWQNDVFPVFYTKLVLVSNERLHAKNDVVGWLFPCGVTFCRTSVSTGKGWLYPAWGDLTPPLVPKTGWWFGTFFFHILRIIII